MEESTFVVGRMDDFCREYLLDYHGTKAAERAGYSKKTAAQQASRMLKLVKIQNRIKELKKDLEKIAHVSKLKTIKELSTVAFSNIIDVIDVEENIIRIKDGKKLSDLPRSITAAISEISETANGLKIKFHNKENAITQLSRMLGWNEPEKTDITTGGEQIKDDFSTITTEELVKRAIAIKSIKENESSE